MDTAVGRVGLFAPKAHMVRITPEATTESLRSTLERADVIDPRATSFVRSQAVAAIAIRTDVCAYYVAELTVRQFQNAAAQFSEAAEEDGVPHQITSGARVLAPEDLAGMQLTEHPYGIQLARCAGTVFVILPRGDETFLVGTCQLDEFLAAAEQMATRPQA
jgi:hypothetical protein